MGLDRNICNIFLSKSSLNNKENELSYVQRTCRLVIMSGHYLRSNTLENANEKKHNDLL